MELIVMKAPQGSIIPWDEGAAEFIQKLKVGVPLRAEVKQIRNVLFFRKWWTLAKLAFDIWNESLYRLKHRGVEVEPNFDRFRKDLIILCGFYTPVYNYLGELRLDAKSISFAQMSEADFEALYSKSIDVILAKVIPRAGQTRESMEHAVENVMRYT